MEKRWSKTEIAFLKKHASDTGLEELAQRFHVEVDTVRKKMAELGLSGDGAPAPESDELVARFQQGVEQVHAGEWAEAAKLLEPLVQESDSRHLADRALQYLNICRRHIDGPAEAEDPYLQAVYEKNEGRIEEARKICAEAGGSDERFVYLGASLDALAGDTEQALETLQKAIELEPRNRVHAYHDPDFESLRGEEGFQRLIVREASA